MPGPSLECRRLRDFDRTDLPSVLRVFEAAPPCELRQAWLPSPEPDLRRGTVRAGWEGQALLVLADLADDDIVSAATRLNERAWELGDTFEMFLEADGALAYTELHVTPGNHHVQLRIPIPRPEGLAPERMMVVDTLFESRVWIETGRWRALAEIPFASTLGRPARFSFSRYDYSRGRAEPVLSSTSPHAALDFHRRHEWGTLSFS